MAIMGIQETWSLGSKTRKTMIDKIRGVAEKGIPGTTSLDESHVEHCHDFYGNEQCENEMLD